MGNNGVDAAGVRFRTLIAHEWTGNTAVTHLRDRSELARDLLYPSAEGT
jgi:hypothetical protein